MPTWPECATTSDRALQGVENAGKYRQDAEREGSPEVAHFMREVQEQNNRMAQRAKELLFRQKQL